MACNLSSRLVSFSSKAIMTSSLFDKQEWFIAVVRTFSALADPAKIVSSIFWFRFSNKFCEDDDEWVTLLALGPSQTDIDCWRLAVWFMAASALCCFISSALFLTSITESSFHVVGKHMMDVAGRCCNAPARVVPMQGSAA